MGQTLIAIGIAVIVAGVIVAFALTPEALRTIGDFTRIGSGFDGALPLPPDEINKAISEANAIATSVNQATIEIKSWAQRLLMLVVLFGAGTTILAGLHKAIQWGSRASTILTLAIGLLGAAAAVSTSGAAYLNGVADTRFACVESIEKEAAKTLSSVRDESDAQAARQYLDDLLRLANRCEA
ncbi:MAG: hypothetical protein EOS23_26660 [Mesorhizobium sp.]|nr:MAG: hypothetical protein EOS23_26660 [Mesorhizobium sp.]